MKLLTIFSAVVLLAVIVSTARLCTLECCR